ncbi:MAG: ATP-binding cassette domain-containing protein [Helicobacteraceae bacterium]|jgi:peptide/nickel transport system ATP-binding protein|nr:ATP-binding cassette domain-containing protein [Helicobacteraceae bacterium]
MSIRINKLKISPQRGASKEAKPPLGFGEQPQENDALVDISLRIDSSLGLAGASGSGKSLTLKALLDLLPRTMIVEKQIDAPFAFERGKTVSFIPQNPFTALSPMSKIKDQFHTPAARAAELLRQTGLGSWALERFPAELSGGQLQRVICAIALSCNPKLLLLDEPTTALDSKSKEAILALFNTIKQSGVKLLFVSHDLASVAAISDAIAIIDRGRIIESAPTREILSAPKSAQTRKLIESGFENREFRR